MKPDYWKAKGCDAREEIDLRVGLSFTTYLSWKLHQMYKTFREANTRISYGPCQFPAFWFCHQRAKEISGFTSEDYWKVVLSIQLKDRKTIDLVYKNEKLKNKSDAENILKSVQVDQNIKVVSIKSEEFTVPKPKPLNTVDMLIGASRRLYFPVTKTKVLSDRLYKLGFISYPRTESRAYGENFEYEKMIDHYSKVENMYQEKAKELLKNMSYVRCEGDDYGDHPPIHPVALPGRQKSIKSKTDSQRLFNYISLHFFASLSEDARLKRVTTTFKNGDLEFKEVHCEYVKLGFCKFLPFDEIAINEYNLSEISFTKGNTHEIKDVKIQKWATAPPPYLSEPDLIRLMEEKGIGTDGTIPGHIRKIIIRKYVELHYDTKEVEAPKKDIEEESKEERKDSSSQGSQNNKSTKTIKTTARFVPTMLGNALGEGFNEIDNQLFEPQVRSFIERSCDKVANYEMVYDTVLEKVIDIFRKKLILFIADFSKLEKRLKSLKSDSDKIDQESKTFTSLHKKRVAPTSDYLMEEESSFEQSTFEQSSSQF